MKKIVILFYLMCWAPIFSQEELTVSEAYKSKNLITSILPFSENVFFVLDGSDSKSCKLLKYENLKLAATKDLVNLHEGNAEVKDMIIFNEKIGIFYEVSQKKTKELFIQFFDDYGEPKGLSQQLFSIEESSLVDKDLSYKLIQSDNEAFLSLSYFYEDKKQYNLVIGHKTFDKDLKLVSQSDYHTETIKKVISKEIGLFLNNQGELIMCYGEYSKAFITNLYESKQEPFDSFINKHVLLLMSQNETKSHVIKLKDDNKMITDLVFTEDQINDKIVLTGIYGVKENNIFYGNKGCAFLVFDLKNDSIVTEKVESFDTNIITEGWEKWNPETEEGKRARRISWGFRDYYHVELFRINGNKHFISVYESINKRTSNVHTLRAEELIVICQDENGDTKWMRRINKEQLTYTPFEKYSKEMNVADYKTSVFCFHSNTTFYLLFNDNISNYDANGKFKSNHKVAPIILDDGVKVSALAMLSFTIDSGDSERNIISMDSELSPSPKYFRLSKDRINIISLFHDEPNYKFGYLHIKSVN